MRISAPHTRTTIPLISLVWLLLLLPACQEQEATPEQVETQATTPATLTATAIASASAVPESLTTEPSTVTALAAEKLEPEETVLPVTPSPTIPPAQHETVGQVPYAASECSDKYPCNEDVSAWESRMQVPTGFEVVVFSRVKDFPTSITFGPDGQLYVAGHSGTIYQINAAGQVSPYINGFTVPTGIAFRPGTEKLYVSSRITNINLGGEGKVSVVEDGQVTTLFDGVPCCYLGMHGPNGIAFGPDGFGYVGVGGRADHGERLEEPDVGQKDEADPLEAAILRFSPDGSQVEVFARGFRNPYDVAWDGDGRLYATENGRDPDLDSGISPPDELHLVVPGGEHGYPYYECTQCFGVPDGVEVIPPVLELIPHGAVTGLVAYTDDSRPAFYNDLFMVTWSSFEGAQKVVRFSPDSGESSDFATGFAQPIDITVGPNGDLFVADFATGLIYRIFFVD